MTEHGNSKQSWLQRARKLSGEKMIRQMAAVSTSQGVTIVALGLLGVILARTLTKSDLGHYRLVFAYLGMLSIIALPGVATVVRKGLAKDYVPIFFKAFRLSVNSSFTAAVLFAVASGISFRLVEDPSWALMFAVFAAFLLIMPFELYQAYLHGTRRFILDRSLVCVTQFLNLAVIGLAAWLTRSVVFAVAAVFLVRATMAIIGFIIVNRSIDRTVPVDPAMDRELMQQGWRFSGLAAFNQVIGQLDSVILGILSPELLAIYYIGTVLPRAVKDTAKGPFIVPTMHWAGLDRDEHRRRVRLHLPKVLGLGLLATAGIALSAPIVIPLLYGEAYRDSVTIAQLLSISIAPLLMATVIETVNIYQDDAKFYQKSLIIKQTGYLIALAALVPTFGVHGIIVAIVGRETANYFMQHAYFIATARQPGKDAS